MLSSLKISFVTPYLSTGGAERAFLNIATSFYNHQLDVDIVAAKVVGNHAKSLPAGLKVFEFKNPQPLDSPSFYKNTKALLRYIKARKPDVVITNSDYLNIAVILARRLSGRKFKVMVSQQIHASSYLKGLPWLNRQFIRLLQRIITRESDMMIGASRGVLDDFAQLYDKRGRQAMTSIYNPIYEEKIVQLAKEKTPDAFNAAEVKLITVGRLVYQKDQATLLHAFKLVLDKLPDARLYIIGVGYLEEKLKEIAGALGIGSRIVFLGYQENPYRFVAKSDLFILSSEYEGFGNVVVEALATGVNVVSTDCPSGPAEILNNGEFGFLCPVRNPEAMCESILHALENPLPAEILHSRAKEFSIDSVAKKYMEAVARCNGESYGNAYRQ